MDSQDSLVRLVKPDLLDFRVIPDKPGLLVLQDSQVSLDSRVKLAVLAFREQLALLDLLEPLDQKDF